MAREQLSGKREFMASIVYMSTRTSTVGACEIISQIYIYVLVCIYI